MRGGDGRGRGVGIIRIGEQPPAGAARSRHIRIRTARLRAQRLKHIADHWRDLNIPRDPGQIVALA